MRILYFADGRSPISLNWIKHFVTSAHEVHLISSTPCEAPFEGLASFHVIPLAFAALKKQSTAPGASVSRPNQGLLGRFARRARYGIGSGAVTNAQYFLGAFEIHRHVAAARSIIKNVRPDLVHAMRIPFEGS